MTIECLEIFLTGHAVIDGEHRKIVDTINKISHVIQHGELSQCPALIDDFLNICESHFATEEVLLAKLRYPDLQAHIIFHRELSLKAKAVRILCMDIQNSDRLKRCFDEMVSLLVEDVIKGDMNFVSFLIEKGQVDPRDHALPITKIHIPNDAKV